ncbi:helix-turn-helix transcriptional regulator [Bacillus benzoevorans]|uniref:Putative ArsR family transcriptional regulator n=1 Tax=Bacillus benzoevorans TaxID=1456 RepID=A0A7X0LXG6_9BACI|nr:metalloregulator ArsR/SmtB family transcription factor [Bacillus benzoevorans]MBB6446399.1 putative ArsR family transcriptional regulator [Bacillus benzoevorans]
MDPTKKSTKDKILELLKKDGLLSVNDLTERLNITHMAVRKHLTQLEKDALIQVSELKQPVGRPLRIYSLTEIGERLFSKNYEGITLEFLRYLQELHGPESIDILFNKREERMTTELSTKLNPFSKTEKVKQLTRLQNEKGYMADLIQTAPETFELIEHNCPILAVAQVYTIACTCETNMLKKVLQTDNITRESCKTDGSHHCRFSIKFK